MAKNTFKPTVDTIDNGDNKPKEETIEQKKEKKKKQKKQKKAKENFSENNLGTLLKGILDGSILTKRFVIRAIPMLLLLVFLGIVFIANRYTIETNSIKINALKKELEQLRNEHIQMKNEYERVSSITEIEKALDSTGIKQSKERPQKIVVK